MDGDGTCAHGPAQTQMQFVPVADALSGSVDGRSVYVWVDAVCVWLKVCVVTSSDKSNTHDTFSLLKLTTTILYIYGSGLGLEHFGGRFNFNFSSIR